MSFTRSQRWRRVQSRQRRHDGEGRGGMPRVRSLPSMGSTSFNHFCASQPQPGACSTSEEGEEEPAKEEEEEEEEEGEGEDPALLDDMIDEDMIRLRRHNTTGCLRSTSSSPMGIAAAKARARRAVSFKPVVRVVLIPTKEELPPRQDLWQTKQEFSTTIQEYVASMRGPQAVDVILPANVPCIC